MVRVITVSAFESNCITLSCTIHVHPRASAVTIETSMPVRRRKEQPARSGRRDKRNTRVLTMKKLMRRLAGAAIFAAVMGAAPAVWGQTDAAAAYQQGKTAFQAG